MVVAADEEGITGCVLIFSTCRQMEQDLWVVLLNARQVRVCARLRHFHRRRCSRLRIPYRHLQLPSRQDSVQYWAGVRQGGILHPRPVQAGSNEVAKAVTSPHANRRRHTSTVKTPVPHRTLPLSLSATTPEACRARAPVPPVPATLSKNIVSTAYLHTMEATNLRDRQIGMYPFFCLFVFNSVTAY